MKKRERKSIPNDVKHELLIECGYRCSVPRCDDQWPTLQFHHIDENPSNSDFNNILVLCPSHHQMATSKHIKRKECVTLKKLLATFDKYTVPSDKQVRNRLLYSLAAELYMNLNLLSERQLNSYRSKQGRPSVYLRLHRNVLDQGLSSGCFIYEQDKQLFSMLFHWSLTLNDFNRCLDLTEYSTFSSAAKEEDVKIWYENFVSGEALKATREACNDLYQYLVKQYGQEVGISFNTVFFGMVKAADNAGRH